MLVLVTAGGPADAPVHDLQLDGVWVEFAVVDEAALMAQVAPNDTPGGFADASSGGEPAGRLSDQPWRRASRRFPAAEFVDQVAEREREHPRWIWADTRIFYPRLLTAGVRVDRCHDLRLSHALLKPLVPEVWPANDPWDGPWPSFEGGAADALFSSDGLADGVPTVPADAAAEYARQRHALARAPQPARSALLAAAESAGALIAAEMAHAGMPWRKDVHEAVLAEMLGPRPAGGKVPAKLVALTEEIRTALGNPAVNPASQADLLKALRRAGISVESTRQWELQDIDHPVIEPLLEYKKLLRLMTANGWNWLQQWVKDGRFRPDYVVGGVVTGRWATHGGGALQLPSQIRSAGVADPGWTLVVGDVAQLEPRILAGMSGDRAMAAAGRAADMYEGMVAHVDVADRAQAKIAMLSAIYGATTGVSVELVPQLQTAFPRAMAYVSAAAARGEGGGVVSTYLGRRSPPPGEQWRTIQAAAGEQGAPSSAQSRARSQSRSFGRFTRNYVVQGTAAEWAMSWMALVRLALHALPASSVAGGAPEPFSHRAHLVLFVHDEIVVHAPAEQAEEVVAIITEAARCAGELLFGDFPLDFPVSIAVVDNYGAVKGKRSVPDERPSREIP